MALVRVDVSALAFSRTCVRCGSAAEVTYGLAVDGRRRVRVPVCVACADRIVGARLAWIASAFGGAACGTLLVASVLDALVGSMPQLRNAPGVIAVGVLSCMVIMIVVPWLALRDGMRAFHRRIGPVWVERAEPPPSNGVVLGARREVVVEPATLPAATLPPWALTLLGVGAGGVLAASAVGEYRHIGVAERRHETFYLHSIVAIAYDVGGRSAVLVTYLALAALAVVLGIGAARAVSRARRARLGLRA